MEKTGKTTQKISGPWYTMVPELLGLLFLLVLFVVNANAFDIDTYGELFHIESAREMLINGRIWIPVLHEHDYLLRSPLWTWIVLLFFKVFGVSLWVARLPAILFSIGGVILTYMVSLSLNRSRFAALFSAAALATTWGFLHLGSLSTGDVLAMDLVLGFAWLLLEWHMLASRRQPLPTELKLFSGGIGAVLGLMLLTKGALMTALLTMLGFGYLILNNSVHILNRINYRYLLTALVLIPLPWLAWASIQTKNLLYIPDVLLFQPINRMLGAGPWQGLRMDPFFYLRKLPAALMPYILFLPAFFIEGAQPRRNATVFQPWMLWLTAWFAGGVLLFSLSAFQEPTALLSLLPPVALLIGYYLDRVIELPDGTPIYNNTLTVYLFGMMAFAVIGTVIVFQVIPSDYTAGFWHLPGIRTIATLEIKDHVFELPEAFPVWKLWLIPGPFVLLAGGLLVFFLNLTRRLPQSIFALLATSACFLLFIKVLYLPVMHRPIAASFAAQINRTARPNQEIVLYSLHPDIKRILFYLRPDLLKHTRFVRKPDALGKILAAGPGSFYGLIREKSYFNDLPYESRNLLRVNGSNWKWDMTRLGELRKMIVVRQPLFDKMKSDLLTFQSVPQNFTIQPDWFKDPLTGTTGEDTFAQTGNR